MLYVLQCECVSHINFHKKQKSIKAANCRFYGESPTNTAYEMYCRVLELDTRSKCEISLNYVFAEV